MPVKLLPLAPVLKMKSALPFVARMVDPVTLALSGWIPAPMKCKGKVNVKPESAKNTPPLK